MLAVGRRLCAASVVVGIAAGASVTSVAASSPVEPPSGSAVPGPPWQVAGVDWGNRSYEVACGLADQVDMVDGSFMPEQYNSDVESLEATVVGAEAVPDRPGYVLVSMTCIAGGPTGALSQNMYVVMSLDESAGDDATAPEGSAPAGPSIAALVIAEPDATVVVNADGVIVVDDTTYGANDPNCCPSVFRSQQVVWDDAGFPLVVEGARPDASPTTSTAPAAGQCVSTELDAASADPAEATMLEQALAATGFEPGPIDGVLDDAAMNAVVRFIEFNAGNPALHDDRPDRPYDNLHAEASQHGVVRQPVLAALGIACPTVTDLPRS